MTNQKTTIQVSQETKKKLDRLGGKGDTYDGIIRLLIDGLTAKKWRK
jgi:hypothetical protein